MPAWINLPNLFTLLRLLLTPLVAWAIFARRPVLAMWLFALAAFTDYLDGAAARLFRSSTPAGAMLDPIADKCLLCGVFLALAAAGMLPWWLVAVVFGRDLYILLGAGAMLLTTPIRRFPPSIWGKVSTCVQIGTVLAWLIRNIWNSWLLNALATAGIWICAAFTLWSGIHYTWRAVRTVRALPRSAPSALPRHTH
jgi:cardiolipin synthase